MAQITFQVDDGIKRAAESTFNAAGMDMGTALGCFLKKVVADERIPCDLNADPFYSASNIRYLEHMKRKIEEGRAHFAEHELIEVD